MMLVISVYSTKATAHQRIVFLSITLLASSKPSCLAKQHFYLVIYYLTILKFHYFELQSNLTDNGILNQTQLFPIWLPYWRSFLFPSLLFIFTARLLLYSKGRVHKGRSLPQISPRSRMANLGFHRSADSTLLARAAIGTGTGSAGVSSSVLVPFPSRNSTYGIAASSGFLTSSIYLTSPPGVGEGTSSISISASNFPVLVSGAWSLTATEPTIPLPSYDPPSVTITGAEVTSEAAHLSKYVSTDEITLARVNFQLLNRSG